MKYIQSIFVTLLMAFGLAACAGDENLETPSNGSATEATLQLLPIAPSAYSGTTRVSTTGTTWSEDDVVFIRIAFYADEAMTNNTSVAYTALRYGSDGNWTMATGSMDPNAASDFTFKVVDAGANTSLWATNEVILWSFDKAKVATVQAIYAGQHPEVALLSGGSARVNINAERKGCSEVLLATRNLTQTDASVPVKLSFNHRLMRLDFGKELEKEMQIISGISGSGVKIIPTSIDFAGTFTADDRTIIPAHHRYAYIMPDEMAARTEPAYRAFRFQEPESNKFIAAFSFPALPAGQNNVSYYYGRSYKLGTQSGGGITPDDMLKAAL